MTTDMVLESRPPCQAQSHTLSQWVHADGRMIIYTSVPMSQALLFSCKVFYLCIHSIFEVFIKLQNTAHGHNVADLACFKQLCFSLLYLLCHSLMATHLCKKRLEPEWKDASQMKEGATDPAKTKQQNKYVWCKIKTTAWSNCRQAVKCEAEPGTLPPRQSSGI